MTIREIHGEPLRYYVDSDSGNTYLVDLLSNHGLGECSCVDFTTRRAPLQKQGERAKCKHINFVQQHFLYDLTSKLSKQYANR